MTAFNALAKVWNAPPLEAAELKSPRDLPDAAARRGLTLTRFNGSLGLLVRTGYPALLELTLPGVTGKRYLALTGLEEGRLRIAPQLPGLTSLSNAELESSWSGVAWIPWKNVDNLPATLSLGSSGKNVGRLQQLLCDARAFDGAQTGVFGKKTAAAVRKFQEVHGLDVDGVADARALLLLYREGGKVAFPRLANQGGNERQ
jgi:general secretion pathway protein A